MRPGIGQRKFPKNTSRIETATFQLAAQSLNQLRDRDVGIPKYVQSESLAFEPCAFQIGMANVELIRYKPQRIDQIPAELIQIGSKTRSEIHKIINSICKMNELLTLKEDILNTGHITVINYTQYFIQNFLNSSYLIWRKKLLGITGVYFDVTDIIVYWSLVLRSANTL